MRPSAPLDWLLARALVESPRRSTNRHLPMTVFLPDVQRRFPSSHWTVAGASWAFRDTDQDAARIPLVLLPGAGGTGDVFYRAIDALRRTRRVVSVSYPALDDADALAS